MIIKLVLKGIHKVKGIYWRIKLSTITFDSKGSNVHISSNFKIRAAENITLGNDIYIGPESLIYGHGKVTIESGSIIGPRVSIYSANHNFKEEPKAIPYDTRLLKKKVAICQNTWIGANVTILPGVTIGEGSIVGAGSVVSKNVDPFSIVAGNPIKKIGQRNQATYNKLKKKGAIYMRIKHKTKGK